MLKRFFGRFLCLFFGHKPLPVTFNEPGRPTQLGDLFYLQLGHGPNTVVVVLNACGRCDELARDLKREPERTHVTRLMIEADAKVKAAETTAKAEAWAKRQRGESIRNYSARMKLANPYGPIPQNQPIPTGVPPGPKSKP